MLRTIVLFRPIYDIISKKYVEGLRLKFRHLRTKFADIIFEIVIYCFIFASGKRIMP